MDEGEIQGYEARWCNGKEGVMVTVPIQSKELEVISDYKSVDMIDDKNQKITHELLDNMTIKKTNVNTVCSLSLFQGHCRKGFLRKDQIHLYLKLFVQYQRENLEMKIFKMKKEGVVYQEDQVFQFVGRIVEGCMEMVQKMCKEPLLSPKAIKIGKNGEVKIGQWEFAHFYQDQSIFIDNDSNFVEEGQTVVQPITANSSESMLQPTQLHSEFDPLIEYYWPPQGTSAIQKATSLGHIPSMRSQKSQIFSLGMTVLHMLLQKPLYQKQTYSQKTLQKYIFQAISLRKQQGKPLSQNLIKMIKMMIKWDPQQRQTYKNISLYLQKIKQKNSSYYSSQQCFSHDFQNSQEYLPPLQTVKSVMMIQNINDSGSIGPGQGDITHPLAQSMATQQVFTVRNKNQSVQIHKLDYTISRQRRQWEIFQHRLHHSSRSMNPTTILFNHTQLNSAEYLQKDEQDCSNTQNGPCQQTKKQYQIIDEEQYTPDQSLSLNNSIKLLDISNIKATQSSQHKNKHKPSNIFSHLVSNYEKGSYDKSLEKEYGHNQSQSMLLKSKSCWNDENRNQNLFTSPQLMALIRESTAKPKELKSHRQEQLDISSQRSVKSTRQVDMTYSNFVKQQLAKGWYQGGKVDGLRNGYGIFHYNQGGKYCGDWLNSKMHGRGTLYYSNGCIAYQGQWKQDSLNGQGILYNENPQKITSKFDFSNFDNSQDIWIYYQGQFKDDDKSGQGTLYLSNGQKYSGEFEFDLINGKGQYYTIDGQIITGIWKENNLVLIESIQIEGKDKIL